jgi:hypothetical protein
MIHRLAAFALVLAFFVVQPPSLYACDCATRPIEESIARADMIVRATVMRMEATETAGVLRLIGSVRETFRGAPSTTLTIYTHPFGASCLGYDFKVGREYVIFAILNNGIINGMKSDVLHMRDAPSTAYIVYLCSGTADTSRPDGHERLAALRQWLTSK